ncbi:MAG: iron hydrogenase [Patescibacteria group bacterium]|nr:iron hydrogenase [Patescibacteria group bacterium]
MKFFNEKAVALVNNKVVVQFLGLAGVAIILPFLINLQWVTGPIVNAILIITLFMVGIRSALVLCLIPSMMALAGGLLPGVLAPIIPFIMIGNVILVLSVDWFYNNFKNGAQGYWLGVLIGASLKFTFLYLSVDFISGLIIKQELAAKIAQMMSWTQLATALTGGMLAWVIIKYLKRI